MQATSLTSGRGNGNGTYPAPMSRRAFIKSAPGRLGVLEDQVEAVELQLDAIVKRLPDPVRAAAIEARLNNLVDTVARLTERVKRVENRSLRSRRKLAVIADQVETSFE